jgi:hypothetical protein
MTFDEIYTQLKDWPRPIYPWPDFIHPQFQEEREEYYAWIDRDYCFQSETAREKHKQHNLTDIAARGLPFLNSLDELRPIANYAANGAMMDDYFDRCSREEMLDLVKRIAGILLGNEQAEPTNDGFMRQWWVLRQDALKCEIPGPIYQGFVSCIVHAFNGYAEEKAYYTANISPPLDVYTLIREATSGGLPFGRYVCLQKDYRHIPQTILDHPHLLRMQTVCAMMIGIHNDFISLPKELYRQGDTMNIVKVMQQEHGVPLETAYHMALAHHDRYLHEFLTLQQHLPQFGAPWKDKVYAYTEDLGVMVSGVYAWHIHDTARYVPGGYVEGEYIGKSE